MIRAVAFCPHPPLLVPEVAQHAAHELDDLRAACRDVLRRAAQVGPEIIVIGSGAQWQRHAATARGSLAPYGVQLEVPLGSDDPGSVELPLSLTVGAWLLRDALGPNCGAVGWSVGADADGGPKRFEPSDETPRSLLVMADGTARRSTTAPGYLDERAADFDALIAKALATGEPELLRFDQGVAADLLVGGTNAWQAAARTLAGAAWDAELLYDAAPYGVGYFVASWTRRV